MKTKLFVHIEELNLFNQALEAMGSDVKASICEAPADSYKTVIVDHNNIDDIFELGQYFGIARANDSNWSNR